MNHGQRVIVTIVSSILTLTAVAGLLRAFMAEDCEKLAS